MEQFTIYCTPEQTKKALELGAPINFEMEVSYDCETMEPNGYEGIKIGKDGEPILIPPTAEQMIGFLGTEGIFVDVHKVYCFPVWHWEVCTDDEHIDSSFEGYGTRKEAIIAALDVALDYLIKNKK